MAIKSNIQWTDATWNIARGCTKVDEDCKYCYMYRESLNGTRYEPKQVTRTKTVFNLPLKLKQPSKIFTSSLTDFFHESIDSYRNEAWDIIRKCPHHTFQILTKRPERILSNLPSFWDEISHHVWLGTSVGSSSATALLRIRALIKLRSICDTLFLSMEPLHAEIKALERLLQIGSEGFLISKRKLEMMIKEYPSFGMTPPDQTIDWIIVGGESGNEKGMYRYRPCELRWIEQIVNDCKEAGVPVFVKQLGTHLAKELKLTDRHGGNIDEWPEHLKVREFPTSVKEVSNG
jgi:protein gp37